MSEHAIRRIDPSCAEREFDALAALWRDGWAEAHAAHVPDALLKLRTLASFRTRIAAYGDALRVAGPVGRPVALCAIKNDHLDQLYVAPEGRGGGLARALLADGEARLRAAGVSLARLDCLPENTRAARFYEKCGWTRRGIETATLDTLEGAFDLPCLVFTKRL